MTGGLSLYVKDGKPKYCYNRFGLERYDIGDEYGSPVTEDYATRRFTGTVRWVQIDVDHDDHNHLIKPEDRLHLAMGLQ